MSSPPVSGLANPKPFLRSNHLIMAVCCAALSSACAQGAVTSQWGAVRVRGGKGGGSDRDLGTRPDKVLERTMVLCAIEMGSGRRTSEELENQRPSKIDELLVLKFWCRCARRRTTRLFYDHTEHTVDQIWPLQATWERLTVHAPRYLGYPNKPFAGRA